MKLLQSFLKLFLFSMFIFCGFVFSSDNKVEDNYLKSCYEGTLKSWARKKFGDNVVDYGPTVMVVGGLSTIALSQYKKPLGVPNPLYGIGKILKKNTISFFCIVTGVMWWRGGWGSRFDKLDEDHGELKKGQDTIKEDLKTKFQDAKDLALSLNKALEEQINGQTTNMNEKFRILNGKVDSQAKAMNLGFNGQKESALEILKKIGILETGQGEIKTYLGEIKGHLNVVKDRDIELY